MSATDNEKQNTTGGESMAASLPSRRWREKSFSNFYSTNDNWQGTIFTFTWIITSFTNEHPITNNSIHKQMDTLCNRLTSYASTKTGKHDQVGKRTCAAHSFGRFLTSDATHTPGLLQMVECRLAWGKERERLGRYPSPALPV